MGPARIVDGGIMLMVRAMPGARRDGVGGVRADAGGQEMLEVRVTAPPEDGRANDAIIAMLARAFGVARRDVGLEAGDIARVKRFMISGEGRLLLARADELSKGKA